MPAMTIILRSKVGLDFTFLFSLGYEWRNQDDKRQIGGIIDNKSLPSIRRQAATNFAVCEENHWSGEKGRISLDQIRKKGKSISSSIEKGPKSFFFPCGEIDEWSLDLVSFIQLPFDFLSSRHFFAVLLMFCADFDILVCCVRLGSICSIFVGFVGSTPKK